MGQVGCSSAVCSREPLVPKSSKSGTEDTTMSSWCNSFCGILGFGAIGADEDYLHGTMGGASVLHPGLFNVGGAVSVSAKEVVGRGGGAIATGEGLSAIVFTGIITVP